MRIIKPISITDSVLTATNVPETDEAEYAPATPYSTGQRVMVTDPGVHNIYEALRATTGEYPPDNTTGTNPAWIKVSSTNRWAMFDGVVSDATDNPTSITIELTPAQSVNSVAFFGLNASTVQVIMTDASLNEVYNTTVNLQDNSAIQSWWSYYFEPIIQRTDLVLLDLPTYSSATIDIIISETGGTATCGELVLGTQQVLGKTDYGTSVGITDYSRKEVDTFGNTQIIQRNFSKIADYNVTIDTPAVSAVQKTLAEFRTTPIVWIGNPDFEETIIYGYYRDFDITISTFSVSDCSIEVEGLT